MPSTRCVPYCSMLIPESTALLPDGPQRPPRVLVRACDASLRIRPRCASRRGSTRHGLCSIRASERRTERQTDGQNARSGVLGATVYDGTPVYQSAAPIQNHSRIPLLVPNGSHRPHPVQQSRAGMYGAGETRSQKGLRTVPSFFPENSGSQISRGGSSGPCTRRPQPLVLPSRSS